MNLASHNAGAPWLSSRSATMARVLQIARDLAATDTTVLLCAETGSGKEVLARHIHACSRRAPYMFLAVNCGALPPQLVESELFGHERGAFSGASERRLGHFETACGGTLVLDEVSELPMPLQTKLLRVLQEREVQRVGASRPTPVDVRVLATTNRDLASMVERGEFRKDLYYRLNVFPLTIPPLRERVEDLPELVTNILARLADRADRSYSARSSDRIGASGLARVVTQRALDRLRAHAFPGNVRELQNVLERAVILAQGGIIDIDQIVIDASFENDARPTPQPSPLPTLFPLGLPGARTRFEAPAPRPTRASLRELERDTILGVLADHSGNRTHAAEQLGISVRTLRNKLREYRDGGHSVPPPATAR